jgi:sugar lactone lactonase YvrE
MQPRTAIDLHDRLGEAPHWDERTGQLLWVDILNGRIHTWKPPDGKAAEWSPPDGELHTETLDGEVTTFIPRADQSGHVVAVDNRIVVRNGGGTERTLAIVEEGARHRFNDTKVDPQGRLWSSTVNLERTAATAGLYRVDLDGKIERVLDATIANGKAWSPDGETFYFTDSITQRIDAYDFDGTAGTIANRRTFAEIDPADGAPDGMTVDAEGGVWVCLFTGTEVRRYTPDGRLDATVSVQNPTCVAFGGPDLGTLYITTGRHRLAPEQLARMPLAGALIALEPDVAGLPGSRFAG